MLSKFSVVADKNTILLIPNSNYQLNCIAINRRNGNCKAHNENQFDFKTIVNRVDEGGLNAARKRPKVQQPAQLPGAEALLENQPEALALSEMDIGYESKYGAADASKHPTVSLAFAVDPCFNILWGFDSVSKTMMFFNVIASEISPSAEVLY